VGVPIIAAAATAPATVCGTLARKRDDENRNRKVMQRKRRSGRGAGGGGEAHLDLVGIEAARLSGGRSVVFAGRAHERSHASREWTCTVLLDVCRDDAGYPRGLEGIELR
jgi:hypothetical protein